ncbi:hypothetical protein EHP00_947 [Ecytonucleospora hepatopenaei]|uniref:Transcription initiation factor IIF subunit alpha n=1 Tax=Ecytonucleospora hepatopenaei TaxID=646526 RepID=A0A1W0E702_9MICR|nr:hypothetical protein EHP00_947 [Ecytonucleospora hepatopenaei]
MPTYKITYVNKKLSLFNKFNAYHLKHNLHLDEYNSETSDEDGKPQYLAKSEIFEYENEEILNIKNSTEKRFVVTRDDRKRFYHTKKQDVSDQSSYFILLQTDQGFNMFEIDDWHLFMHYSEKNENSQEEKLEKVLQKEPLYHENNESVEEIDYNENFDDDDDGDIVVHIEKERKLSTSGTAIQNLVTELDIDNVQTWEKNETEALEEEKSSKKLKRAMSEKDLYKVFGSKTMSIKELLKNLTKLDFKLDDDEKQVIKKFLQNNCTVIQLKNTKEKHFKIKKNLKN